MNKESYRCDFCGKSFVVKDNLYHHLSKNKDCYDFYYRDKVENVDYVTCRICGKRLNRIFKEHLKMHGMTTEEYRLLFPDAVLTAQETKDKRKRTNLERYGVENPFAMKEIKEKVKQTFLERYNVEHPMQIKEVRDKFKQTCLERYSVENPTRSEEIKNRIKQTCLERYGVDSHFKSQEVRDKIKQTFLDRYGVKNPLQIKEIRDKIRQTNLEKYGVEYPLLSEEIQDKIRQTNLQRYGVKYTSQVKEVKDKIRNTVQQKYGIYYRTMPGFSLTSQELFTSIELILSDMYPDLECFYATNKEIKLGGKLVTNEYQVLVESVSNNKKVRFLDFYIPTLKKWIEFDESYHDNIDQLNDDKIREQEIKAVIPDIELLRIKEEDYLNDKGHTVEKCIDFILS
jgi:hypothetical protein